jgi:hypothetical protein
MPSLLTWRLWRALRFPDETSPLFQRVQAQPSVIPGRGLLRRLSPLLSAVAVLLSAVAVLIAPALLLVMSNLFGGLVALNVMNTINREREQQTYDLLALTPFGRGTANWQIAAACLNRLDAIDRLASLRSLALMTLVLLLIYSLGGRTLTPILFLALLLALNLDAIQSQVVGCLSGMLAQEFTGHSASFVALAIFAFAQVIAVYLPVTGIAILVFNLCRRAGIDRWLGDALVGGIALALLFLLRETIIRLMWRELERRLL